VNAKLQITGKASNVSVYIMVFIVIIIKLVVQIYSPIPYKYICTNTLNAVIRRDFTNMLLTKSDLAKRWQVSEKAIDDYRAKGIISAIKELPSVRFNPQHIDNIEGTKLERFSPLERKKLEMEIEILKNENELLKQVIRNILSEALKAITI